MDKDIEKMDFFEEELDYDLKSALEDISNGDMDSIIRNASSSLIDISDIMEKISYSIKAKKDIFLKKVNMESFSKTYSRDYKDPNKFDGYVGFGFFIRRVEYYKAGILIRYYDIFSQDNCDISDVINGKGEVFFTNPNNKLKSFPKLEDAKKYCILQYMKDNKQKQKGHDVIKITRISYPNIQKD